MQRYSRIVVPVFNTSLSKSPVTGSNAHKTSFLLPEVANWYLSVGLPLMSFNMPPNFTQMQGLGTSWVVQTMYPLEVSQMNIFPS